MNRSMRSDLRKSVRTVLSSREGGMDKWIPRRVEPDSRESDEQVEAVLLQLRGLLAREGGALTGRERAPYGEEAGFLSWVEHNGSVLLTTAPVRRLYEEVARW